MEIKLLKGDKEQQSGDIFNLIRDVNPEMTWSQMIKATQSYLELYGKEYWHLVRSESGKKILEIWPLNPTRVTPKVDSDNMVVNYEVNNGKEKITLDTSEIIPFWSFDPTTNHGGIGPVAAAENTLDIDYFSQSWNRNFFENSAMPGGIISTSQILEDEQYERLLKEWQARHQGEDNAHRVALLDAGMAFSRISLSPEEMQFGQQRKDIRDEILGIFRVPKSLLGITEDVNRANAEASEYMFSKYVVKPKMQSIVDVMNEWLLPAFELKFGEYRFELIDPVPENRELARLQTETDIKNGIMTINEVRADRGLAPVDGGDIPLIPISQIPLSADIASSTDLEKTAKAAKRSPSRERIRQNIMRYIELQTRIHRPKIESAITQIKDQVINHYKALKSVKKASTTGLDEMAVNWPNILIIPVKQTIKEAYGIGGQTAAEYIESQFALDNPEAVAWLEQHATESVKTIAQTFLDEIKILVLDAAADGLGGAELMAKLSDYFATSELWKAERIARTELSNGYNAGAYQTYQQSGVVSRKEWILDGRPCDDCIANAKAGVIPFNAEFPTGHLMPTAHPNCMCSIRPIK